jgi:hypothetical protein
MGIEFKSNFNPKQIAEIIRERNKRNLDLALTDAVAEIERRTTAGKDVNNATFKKLSPKYKAIKTLKTGRSYADMTGIGSKEAQAGAMLAAMTHTIATQGNAIIGTIKFRDTLSAVKAAANMKLRRFFDLSKEQIAKITEMIRGK